MAESIFEASPSTSWQVDGGEKIAFPIENIREVFRNRLVQHERMARDGARLEDTYAKAIGWQITVAAYNSEDHEEDVDGGDFYPTVLNKLLDSFKIHETGTLITSTRGPRRCRAESYERVEDNATKDTAAVVLTFLEDNEDDAEVANWAAPTAASIIVKTAQDAVRALEEEGVGGDAAASLNELASGIEGYASAPGEFVADLEAKADLLSSTVDRIEKAHTNLSEEVGDEAETLMLNPSASRAGRLLRKLSDTGQRASGEKLQLPDVIARTWPNDLSLFDIAPILGMSAEDIMRLNPALDPFFVPAGTTIQVYA